MKKLILALALATFALPAVASDAVTIVTATTSGVAASTFTDAASDAVEEATKSDASK